MKRAALYVRVSTVEQKKHGLSVDNQIEALKKYCKDNNYIVTNIYNDAGFSARKKFTRRPALLNLVEDCEQGKIDIILFTKLDRWFRSVGDYYEVQSRLDACKVPWRAIWEDYETETSSGVFKVNIMLSVAQSEADRTSERIKATMAYKRGRGDYVGSAPTGYIVNGPELIKDKNIEDAMNAFFNKYFATYSVTKAIQEAEKYGLLLNRNHMLRLIKNPAYYGETVQGYKCEPYITKEQHNIIINNSAKNARSAKYAKRTYLFSGICFCGYCGHRMVAKTATRVHSDGERVYHKKYTCQYYSDMRCKCPHIQVSESNLENFLLAAVDSLLEDYRTKVNEINMKFDGNNIKRKTDLESKLKRLSNIYMDGDISLEDYRIKRDKIREEINSLVIDPIPEPVQLPAEWKEIYAELDDEHKRTFWVKTIKSITVTNENKATPTVEFM